jgi:hypothetical protein
MSLKSLIPLVLAALLSILVVIRKWHTQPLATLTPEQVNASRIAEGSVLAVVLAAFFS